MRAKKGQRGLSLVEVLVALGISAVALLAANQAMSAMTHAVQRQQQVMLAQWCADNVLVQVRLSSRFPAVGKSQQTCEQFGLQFEIHVHTSATANPSFRRVQAQVFQGGYSVLSVSTVVGRY